MFERRSKNRPRDVDQLAKSVVDLATSEAAPERMSDADSPLGDPSFLAASATGA